MAGLATVRAQHPTRHAKYSIGQVLQQLANDFNDLTPSKLRFLEEQGLITPERTPSGYRKFTQEHIERLRLILTLQRDHYLPLKKISECLAEADAGRDPQIPGAAKKHFSSILQPRAVLTRDELLRQAGVSSQLLGEAISAGLVPATEIYPAEALAQMEAVRGLAERGLTPRHLRTMQVAAEREASLIRQAVAARTGKSGGPANQDEELQLAELFATVHSGVVRQALLRQRP